MYTTLIPPLSLWERGTVKMPTITIDIPDNLSVRDARSFVLRKIDEPGFLVPNPSVDESDEVDDDPDSWFPLELQRKAKERRRRLDEEFRRNPPPLSREEYLQLVLNGPVASEEAIRRQDEVTEHMRQWKMPW